MKNSTLLLPSKQQGNVLIIFIILIAAVTTIAIKNTDNAKFEQSMSGNSQYKMQLFNDAERRLVLAEKFILTNIAASGSEQTYATYKASSPAGVTFSAGTDVFTTSSLSGTTFELLQSDVVVETTGSYPPVPSCGNGGMGCLEYYKVTASGSGDAWGAGFTGASATVESIFTVFIPYVAP